jgi:hypothetical protein
VFCDLCGQQFFPRQSTCSRCRVIASRYWLQFLSLVILFAAAACNSLVALFLLPRLASGHHPRFVFRAWLWLDHQTALYSWIPIAVGLLTWDYIVWKHDRPKIRGWFTRKLLMFVLAAGLTPILPWWVPAGQPPGQFLDMISRYAGLPTTIAWGTVLLALLLICVEPQSRDTLLGHGKTLSLVSSSILLLVLSMSIFCWCLT